MAFGESAVANSGPPPNDKVPIAGAVAKRYCVGLFACGLNVVALLLSLPPGSVFVLPRTEAGLDAFGTTTLEAFAFKRFDADTLFKVDAELGADVNTVFGIDVDVEFGPLKNCVICGW